MGERGQPVSAQHVLQHFLGNEHPRLGDDEQPEGRAGRPSRPLPAVPDQAGQGNGHSDRSGARKIAVVRSQTAMATADAIGRAVAHEGAGRN